MQHINLTSGKLIALIDSVTIEPAQNCPILFNKIQVGFQRQQTKTASHVTKICTEERNLTSSCTQNQSLTSYLPIKGLRHNQNLNIRPISEAEGPVVQEDLVLTPLYHKWPIKTCPTSASSYLFPYIFKNAPGSLAQAWAFEH